MRAKVPRCAHADWTLRDRAGLLRRIESSTIDRIPSLLPLHYGRMTASPFAFLRGTAGVMAHDLARTAASGITVQLCGDAHCANFGGFATPERNFIFDVNDFDETLPGPWEWDLKRLAVSLVLVARQHAFRDRDGADAVRAAVEQYRERMRRFAGLTTLDLWYERVDAAPVFARVARTLPKHRATPGGETSESTVREAFETMTEVVRGRRRFVDRPPLTYHVAEADAPFDVEALLASYRKSLRDDLGRLFDRFEFVDWAMKVVGVGSVGTRCAVVLLLAGEDDPLLLQIKEAGASVLEAWLGRSEFDHHGRRVVAGQRLMQSASDLFLGWANDGGRDYYLRSLRDLKGAPNFDSMNLTRLDDFARYCGWTLAAAHGRNGRAREIAGYVGAGDAFDDAIAEFARRYAEQVERDYGTFMQAVASGQIVAQAAAAKATT